MTPKGYWKRDHMLALCRDWVVAYGVPPRGEDWKGSNGRFPSKATVERHFGTWNEMIAVAGFEPRTAATKCLYWTEELIVAACREFHDKHGRIPKAGEWRDAAFDHPTAHSVQRRFGSWNKMIAAAGFEPRRAGSPVVWTKDAIADAMVDWRVTYGKWPTAWDWRVSHNGDVPFYATVKAHFGTWNTAKRYAGWDPDAASRTLPRTKCVGCDGDLDTVTIGCQTCWDRNRNRQRRADGDYREWDRRRAQRRRDELKVAA